MKKVSKIKVYIQIHQQGEQNKLFTSRSNVEP